jgi:hypothetical protein
VKERIVGEVTTRNKPHAVRIAESGSYTYVGCATVGSSESAEVWQIKRINDTGSGFTIEWADGDTNFDNNWSQRGSLSYS